MGRPKLKGVKRDKATGRSRGLSPDEVTAVAFNARIRRVGPSAIVTDIRTGGKWANAKSGYSLGILNLWGHVSDTQHDTGIKYANMVYRYCALRGLPLPTPKSPSIVLVSAGQACRDEPDDDQVLRARRQHSDARAALLLAGMAIGQGSRVNGITFAVCIEDIPAESLSEADIGNLRVGLNALGRVL
jgi:hypothetical protein